MPLPVILIQIPRQSAGCGQFNSKIPGSEMAFTATGYAKCEKSTIFLLVSFGW